MTEHEVEVALRDLSARLDVPEPPDVTAAVLTRISVPPKRNRLLAAVIAALVAFAIAVAASPAVRAGIVEILEFAGIEFSSQPPPSAPGTPPERTVSLEEAREVTPFEIRVPAALGAPSEILVEDGRFVSLVYDGVRLDQFDGTIDPVLRKVIGRGELEAVAVNGTEGIWVDKPHDLYYYDKAGKRWIQAPRLAGSTLIWQQDGVTFRLEGELTKERAVAIATG